MAITATFVADFTPFNAGVQTASKNLATLEGGSVETAAALNQMLDTVGLSGGRMSGLGTATSAATTQLGGMNSAFSAFDGILMAGGVNVSKYARGLEDIARAAVGGTASLGALGTAGVVVGTGLAIANIIQAAQAYLDLDNRIAGATARMMGWGDAAREAREAGTDQLVLATQRAKREITNMSEALQINAKWQQENTWRQMDQADAHDVSSGRLAAAQREVRGLSAATIAAIEIAQRNHATTEQITRVYGISADGLRALAERQKLAGQMADVHTKALEKQQAEVEKLDTAYAKLMSDVKNANQLAIMEADHQNMVAAALTKKNNAAAGWISQQVAVTAGIKAEASATTAYLAEQEALTAATDALGKMHTEGGAAASAATAVAVAGYQGVAQAVQISGDAIEEWIDLMQYSAQVNSILSTNSLFKTQSQYQQIANLQAPRSAGSGGATVNNVFNIVDTEANIARRVSDHITRSVMQMGAV